MLFAPAVEAAARRAAALLDDEMDVAGGER
jgi:hypothetical protein